MVLHILFILSCFLLMAYSFRCEFSCFLCIWCNLRKGNLNLRSQHVLVAQQNTCGHWGRNTSSWKERIMVKQPCSVVSLSSSPLSPPSYQIEVFKAGQKFSILEDFPWLPTPSSLSPLSCNSWYSSASPSSYALKVTLPPVTPLPSLPLDDPPAWWLPLW